MRTSKRFTALALVAGLAVMASACGSDKKAEPAATTTGVAASTTTAGSGSSTPGTDGSGSSTPGTGSTGGKVDGTGKSACEVTDSGGVDDKGFNQTAYDGVKQAATEFGIKPELLESKSDADYTPNIDAFVKKKCSIIITVGFLLAPNTATAAKANPDQQFAIVDSPAVNDNGTPSVTTDDKPLPNVSALLFATEQPSYLAGYLAAGMSKSGKVATYGGIQIPPVTSFMNGFLQGVNQHNKVHGT
ncbi:MAG: BMP family ABC transporter substrate-binding protein, partial [Ilumatobacteraceae bacterium]